MMLLQLWDEYSFSYYTILSKSVVLVRNYSQAQESHTQKAGSYQHYEALG